MTSVRCVPHFGQVTTEDVIMSTLSPFEWYCHAGCCVGRQAFSLETRHPELAS
jgi:hypothetical protein